MCTYATKIEGSHEIWIARWQLEEIILHNILIITHVKSDILSLIFAEMLFLALSSLAFCTTCLSWTQLITASTTCRSSLFLAWFRLAQMVFGDPFFLITSSPRGGYSASRWADGDSRCLFRARFLGLRKERRISKVTQSAKECGDNSIGG